MSIDVRYVTFLYSETIFVHQHTPIYIHVFSRAPDLPWKPKYYFRDTETVFR